MIIENLGTGYPKCKALENKVPIRSGLLTELRKKTSKHFDILCIF